jgi:DmsE family decaheme c-type cytochrome
MTSNKHIILIGLLFALLSSVGFAQQDESKSPAKRTAQFTEEGSEACMVCHSGEKMHAIAASPHANPEHPSTPLSNQGCEACHGPGSIHVSRAHGGQGFPKMITFGRGSEVSAREEQIDACLSCHSEELGSTQAIEFWGGVHDRKNINCSRCHLMHAETDPISEKEFQDAVCYKCHRKMKTEHPRFEDKSIDFDALSCWTCHDVHKVNDEVN